MAGKIIGFLCSILCAVHFLVIAQMGVNGEEPISFWSGDTSLKDKVKNIHGYNLEMAALFRKYALAFVIAGVLFWIWPLGGIILIVADSTLGIFVLYRGYKRILNRYL